MSSTHPLLTIEAADEPDAVAQVSADLLDLTLPLTDPVDAQASVTPERVGS